MDIPETTLESYRIHLKQCEYPNILKMDQKDIQKILCKDNRSNFLLWALTKIDPKYESRFEQFKKLQKVETVLAETLYSNGCCLQSQKNDFIFGKLKVDEEIKIFDRIFNLLSSVYTNVDRENISPQIASIMYSLQHPDKDFEKKVFASENLFGDKMKLMSENDLLKKFNKYGDETISLDKQILETENELDELKKEMNNLQSETNTNDDIDELSNKLSNVMSNFTKDFPEYTAHFLKLPEKSLNENFGSIVTNCSENIDHIKKILDNKNYLHNLHTPKEERDSTASEFVVDNFTLSEELLS